MKRYILQICIIFILSAFIMAASKAGAPDEESPGGSQIFVSFLWAGKTETECKIMDSLITDNIADCQDEFTRIEAEVKQLVEKKNLQGAQWTYGVILNCGTFPNLDTYTKEMENYEKKCKGQ